MIVLDSDYLSLLEWPEGDSAQKILRELKGFGPEDVATTIVSFEEQMNGWIQAIRGHTEVKDQIEKYRRMRRSLRSYCSINILDFDEVAAGKYASMVRQVGVLRKSFDRLIAAHALAMGLVLVTNNAKHFSDVPGLVVENWSV